MIKTLRITGVAAVAFAGLVLASVLGPVSLIHLDNKNDQRISKVQSSPGAVERFHEQHKGKDTSGQDTKPPLVRQAELFKDIIDPKPVATASAPVTPGSVARTTPVALRPVNVSVQFALLGTSCSASDPNRSFAYIRDSSTNEVKWVQCGDALGHLTIKEVRETSILCWDGQRDREVPMEAVPDRVGAMIVDAATISSVETPVSQSVPVPVPVRVTESPAIAPRGMPRPTPPAMRSGALKTPEEEQRIVNELMEKYRKMQSPSGAANAATTADRLALANKLMSELRSSRVSPQETRKLENMADQVVQNNERTQEEQDTEAATSIHPSNLPRD